MGRRAAVLPAALLLTLGVACGGPVEAPGGAGTATATDAATAGGARDGASPTPGRRTPRSPGAEQPGTATPANAAALDFTAPALGGGTARGAELAGGDVVLWMWAPW